MIMHKITAKDSILDSKQKPKKRLHASLKIESIKLQLTTIKQTGLSLTLMNLKEEEEGPC